MPFLHSLIQFEGNYRPREAFEILPSGPPPNRTPPHRHSPPELNWVLLHPCVELCITHQREQTETRAFPAAPSRPQHSTTPRDQKHPTDSHLWPCAALRAAQVKIHYFNERFHSLWNRSEAGTLIPSILEANLDLAHVKAALAVKMVKTVFQSTKQHSSYKLCVEKLGTS